MDPAHRLREFSHECPGPDNHLRRKPRAQRSDIGMIELGSACRSRACWFVVMKKAGTLSLPEPELPMSRLHRPSRLTPCLWFDDQAEAAVALYTDVFADSRITRVTHYGQAGHEMHGRRPGSVMTVSFELDGHALTALNGGPLFRLSEAFSLQVHCETQDEIDHYWHRLGAGGDPASQVCGWLKDRYGLSWQIVPRQLDAWIGEGGDRAERVLGALLQMQKLDLAALARAAG